MILYRKEPIPLQMKNIILLDDNDSNGVVYLNKHTFEQAVILYNRLDGSMDRMINVLKGKATLGWEKVEGLKEAIELMFNTMPKPVNILAPFLMYCANNQGIDWNNIDRETAYGFLHEFSMVIDFNAITIIPSEVRLDISIPTVILKQFRESWNSLTKTLEDEVMLRPIVTSGYIQPITPIINDASTVTPYTPTTTSNEVDEEDDVLEGEEEMSEEEYEKLMAEFAALENELEEKNKKIDEDLKNGVDNKEEAVEESKPEQLKESSDDDKSLLQDEKKKEAEECSKILDEFDV